NCSPSDTTDHVLRRSLETAPCGRGLSRWGPGGPGALLRARPEQVRRLEEQVRLHVDHAAG
ncbi:MULTISPECIES: hypothetical protein, partial [Streptomyces]|uniref:hypothetical protein n=1 Tax=Streptomyces TaxID=1883 RepID=UPI0019D05706